MAYDIIIGRDESDKKNFGNRGLISIGKSFVKMGKYTSLSNKILMDIARSHVVLVAGKRGSGKSYTLGVIAEEISNLPSPINKNIATVMFDTMGIYWTMKYKNEKDKELLSSWDLKSKKLPVKIFVPYGYYDEYVEKGIPVDEPFALNVAELKPEDWITTFGLTLTDPVSILIERTLVKLKDSEKYDIEDIIALFEADGKTIQQTKNAAIGLFEAAATWGIFAKKTQQSIETKTLIKGGLTSILDLSAYSSIGSFNVRALVISLISRKIFNERMLSRKKEEVNAISQGLDYLSMEEEKEDPLVWIFIDEAHEFLPLHGKTVATDALIQLLREGRQPGVSVVLATQQPGKIHTDVMTQSDIVISHRVTSQQDLVALNQIMQSYLLSSIQKYMDDLPDLKGSAIILDDNSERIYPMRMRPRFTWHGGEAPTAISKEKSL